MVKKHGFRLKGRIFMTIGEKIKERREELGLSLEELAEMTRIGHMPEVETGELDLNIDDVACICESLELSADYLVGLNTNFSHRLNKLITELQKISEILERLYPIDKEKNAK